MRFGRNDEVDEDEGGDDESDSDSNNMSEIRNVD